MTFTLDWSAGYLSPLTFVLALLGPDGEDPRLRARLRIRKTGQIFADGRTFPPVAGDGGAAPQTHAAPSAKSSLP